jgi:hypothetical protein
VLERVLFICCVRAALFHICAAYHLHKQLKAAQATGAGGHGTSAVLQQGCGHAAEGSIEALAAQVVRLKRQRDRLMQDQRDLGAALAEAHAANAHTMQELAAARV